MAKSIRSNSKISNLKAKAIIGELERWRDRELGTKLTWERIESFSGFTRQAMSRHPEIALAYQEAKRALAEPERPSRSRSIENERTYFDQALKDLRMKLKRYEDLELKWFQEWQRIEFHCLVRGMTIDELDKPMDNPGRKVKSTKGDQKD